MTATIDRLHDAFRADPGPPAPEPEPRKPMAEPEFESVEVRDDPDPFMRGCYLNAGFNQTERRKSDSVLCTSAMRMAECGCQSSTPATLMELLAPKKARGFPIGSWSDPSKLPPGCQYVDIHDDSQTLVACTLTAADDRPAAEFPDTDAVPRCEICGSPLRPDVVWFGEMLPAGALERAQEAAQTCDLFLSVGTSNLVEPAASLPWLAAASGATVLVVNTSMEGQRSGARIHHPHGPSGRVLPELLRAAWPD